MVKAKDWTGNAKSIFTCNGASNHSEEERQIDDYYATEPKAVELLLEREKFSNNIWECACGGGHMSEVLKQNGYCVYSSDLVDRHYQGTIIQDFLKSNEVEFKSFLFISKSTIFPFIRTSLILSLNIFSNLI